MTALAAIRPWLLRNFIMPVGDLVWESGMMRRLALLERAQWWDRVTLYKERDRLLSEVVATAYREVPFYQDLMDRHKVLPKDIRAPEDLRRLPIVTKEMIRSAYPRLVTRSTGHRTWEERTSGSTGTNFRVLEDAPTAGWYRASFLLSLEWAGWRFGEAHLQTGMTLKRGLQKRLKDALLNCHYLSAYMLDDASLDAGLDLIWRRGIRHLWGYPGSLYYLARRAKERGRNTRMQTLVTWGDSLYPHYRETIESAFGTSVHDTFGCAEGMQIAAQCGQGDTYHLHALDVIVECVDDCGEPVPAGRPGHLILTRLHAGPMPLIRYRVGDLGTLMSEADTCRCGRGFPLLKNIQGRDTDVVVTPSGNRLIVHFFTGVLEHFTEIDTFQVEQHSAGTIVLRIVPFQPIPEDLVGQIRKALWDKGAAGLEIDVQLVDAIPLTSGGKRRFIIRHLALSPDRRDDVQR